MGRMKLKNMEYEPWHEEFRERLIRTRKEKGLKQYVLSELCGLGSHTLGRIENGEFIPSLRVLIRISEALNTTPNELLGFDDSSP